MVRVNCTGGSGAVAGAVVWAAGGGVASGVVSDVAFGTLWAAMGSEQSRPIARSCGTRRTECMRCTHCLVFPPERDIVLGGDVPASYRAARVWFSESGAQRSISRRWVVLSRAACQDHSRPPRAFVATQDPCTAFR